PRNRHALLEPPLPAYSPTQSRHLAREMVFVRNGLIEGGRDSPIYSFPVRRQTHVEIAITKCDHRREYPLRPGFYGDFLCRPIRLSFAAIEPRLAAGHGLELLRRAATQRARVAEARFVVALVFGEMAPRSSISMASSRDFWPKTCSNLPASQS